MALRRKSIWLGDKVSKEIKEAALNSLSEGASFILDESNKIAPIDEGTLIQQSRVEVKEDTVLIIYSAPYSLRQHEKIGYKHKNGRKPKFLETAYKENIQDVMLRVGKEIKKNIEG